MAQFEALNEALDGISQSVDDLVARLEGATVEDPAVQQQIDEAVNRIAEVQGKIDAIAAGASGADQPHVDNTLPGDLPKGG